MGEVERLRNETIEGWAGFADEYGPKGRVQIVSIVDTLISAVRADERERRDREWLAQFGHIGVTAGWGVRMGYEWRDDAWRKIEEVRDDS